MHKSAQKWSTHRNVQESIEVQERIQTQFLEGVLDKARSENERKQTRPRRSYLLREWILQESLFLNERQHSSLANEKLWWNRLRKTKGHKHQDTQKRWYLRIRELPVWQWNQRGCEDFECCLSCILKRRRFPSSDLRFQ